MTLNSLNAVVTGATGFIGSALCHEIVNCGGKVAAIVRKESSNIARLPRHPNLFIIDGSTENVKEWENQIYNLNVDFEVFYHLAWEGVGNTARNSGLQINNINPAIETLYIAKQIGCTKWIGAGSQAEYGPLNKVILEADPTFPTTMYGASKLATAHLSRITGEQIGIKTVWARIFSTYGPGDNSGWMLTDLIRQLIRKEWPRLTKGEQLWDYLFVSDAALAFFALGCSEESNGIYNLGSGQSYTIRYIVETVRDMIEPGFELVFGDIPYRQDQVMHLEANIEKIKRDTNWNPKVNLHTGLEKTIHYIRQLIRDGR